MGGSMLDLSTEYWYAEDDTTNFKDIEMLALSLLDTPWSVSNHHYASLLDMGWRFEWNNKKRACGSCSYSRKTIYLSRFLFSRNKDKAMKWENTLRHEVAHAIDNHIRGSSNHDEHWKMIARSLLADPSYSWSGEMDSAYKYKVYCLNCGDSHGKHRKSSREAACRSCCMKYNNGKYSRDYLLTYQLN